MIKFSERLQQELSKQWELEKDFIKKYGGQPNLMMCMDVIAGGYYLTKSKVYELRVKRKRKFGRMAATIRPHKN